MKKLIGLYKTRTAIFISGKGSNLKNLLYFSLKKNSPICIKLIVSNSKKAKGLRYAVDYKVRKKIINFNNTQAENRLLKLLINEKINLICLAGFMKILSKNFIKKFKGKILNIHPSLLPKYKGLNTHQKVLINNEKYSGCTVHFVTTRLDSGKIILQKKIVVKKKDTENSLKKRILIQEHKLYPKAIIKVLAY